MYCHLIASYGDKSKMSHKKLKNSSQHQRNKLCKLRTNHRKSIGKLNGVTHANANFSRESPHRLQPRRS